MYYSYMLTSFFCFILTLSFLVLHKFLFLNVYIFFFHLLILLFFNIKWNYWLSCLFLFLIVISLFYKFWIFSHYSLCSYLNYHHYILSFCFLLFFIKFIYNTLLTLWHFLYNSLSALILSFSLTSSIFVILLFFGFQPLYTSYVKTLWIILIVYSNYYI